MEKNWTVFLALLAPVSALTAQVAQAGALGWLCPLAAVPVAAWLSWRWHRAGDMVRRVQQRRGLATLYYLWFLLTAALTAASAVDALGRTDYTHLSPWATALCFAGVCVYISRKGTAAVLRWGRVMGKAHTIIIVCFLALALPRVSWGELWPWDAAGEAEAAAVETAGENAMAFASADEGGEGEGLLWGLLEGMLPTLAAVGLGVLGSFLPDTPAPSPSDPPAYATDPPAYATDPAPGDNPTSATQPAAPDAHYNDRHHANRGNSASAAPFSAPHTPPKDNPGVTKDKNGFRGQNGGKYPRNTRQNPRKPHANPLNGGEKGGIPSQSVGKVRIKWWQGGGKVVGTWWKTGGGGVMVGWCFLATAVCVMVMGTLGPAVSRAAPLPLFLALQGIGASGAFQRLEALGTAAWTLSYLALALLSAAAAAELKPGNPCNHWVFGVATLLGGLLTNEALRPFTPLLSALSLLAALLLPPGKEPANP